VRPALALATLILSFVPCASFAADTALLALGMEHFRDTASVSDDPGASLTTISTERGYVEGSGPMREVWHDEFLTAVIDHKAGQKSFQIDVSTTYSGTRRSYPSADLEAMGGPKAVTPALIRTESVNCSVGECIYTDHVRIPVEEALLRRLANDYRPGSPVILRFQLNAKRRSGYRGEISNAEIAGLLVKVDAYEAAPSGAAPSGAAPSAAVAQAAAPRRLDLGMSGLAVAPAADNPGRAGVLVVAVNGESVAQRAGLITGDIIFEIGDRPTHSLADLEDAINASAAHADATIKIFRGLKEMSLKARF
jgi:hypothetical protein